MAVSTSNDVYDDPDNILADVDDTVDGATELPEGQADSLGQSIFLPDHDEADERGDLEMTDPLADAAHIAIDGNGTDDHEEDMDMDADKLGDMDPADENDDTES